MRTYKVFYKGKSVEIKAESSYDAQEKGAKLLGAKRTHQVATILCDVPVNTASL
jgi:hypothetical protein